MSDSDERVKLTMTMTPETVDWLTDSYPEALETQEAVRMAISDARAYNNLRENLDADLQHSDD